MRRAKAVGMSERTFVAGAARPRTRPSRMVVSGLTAVQPTNAHKTQERTFVAAAARPELGPSRRVESGLTAARQTNALRT